MTEQIVWMETRVDEEKLVVSEKLLLTMHNISAVRPEMARTDEELSRFVQITVSDVQKILSASEREGYVKSLTDRHGRRYFLTGKGILKVCSSFT